MLAAVGDPHRHYATVHVAGTNGKGSTSAFLAAMLRSAGFRGGLYTSPHLLRFPERIQVDGVPIAEGAVAAWTARLHDLAVDLGATFFEITTAIALADFAARGADIAVVEVGLGGRLDATNVVEPLATGVTRIALDHAEYLGTDLAGIAREKGGIAKPGVPFLTTETDEQVLAAMGETVGGRGSRVERVSPWLARGYRLGLEGPHQVANASLALALARALPPPWRPGREAERAGLAGARLAGRFDRRGPWLFDVAHNPDGMAALAEALAGADLARPLAAVVAILRDKAWPEMLARLGPVLDVLVLTRAPSAPAERSWDFEEVARGGWRSPGRGGGPDLVAEPDLSRALGLARERAATVVVTGSFHTVGDAMGVLRFEP